MTLQANTAAFTDFKIAIRMIPYGRQDITQDDIDAVIATLRSDFLTQGPVVPAFEEAVSTRVRARHAVAVSSATAALHIACLALGLGPGDRLWTTPITFVASANCGLYCGAQIDFVDIDPHTCNLCPQALERKLIAAEKSGSLPKVVVPVHLGGQPCDMKAIHELALRFGFKVIEDASHAIGSRYRGEPVGNCRYSDITVFSFHPVKIITSAEGGMAVTNHAELAQTMALLRNHGITRDPALMTHEPEGPWYYQQVDLGFNYRLTDLQAALGLSQLSRLESYVARRQVLAGKYDSLLGGMPLILPGRDPQFESAYHLYVIQLHLDHSPLTHRMIFDRLRMDGIGVNLHYIPLHLQPYYRRMGFEVGTFPNSERYYARAISLPLHPGLTDSQQQQVADSLHTIFSKGTTS